MKRKYVSARGNTGIRNFLSPKLSSNFEAALNFDRENSRTALPWDGAWIDF